MYSKAPGVIKQLAFVVGEDPFRDGLRLYLKEHAYANAEWSDLVHALERTSKKPLADGAAHVSFFAAEIALRADCWPPTGQQHSGVRLQR